MESNFIQNSCEYSHKKERLLRLDNNILDIIVAFKNQQNNFYDLQKFVNSIKINTLRKINIDFSEKIMENDFMIKKLKFDINKNCNELTEYLSSMKSLESKILYSKYYIIEKLESKKQIPISHDENYQKILTDIQKVCEKIENLIKKIDIISKQNSNLQAKTKSNIEQIYILNSEMSIKNLEILQQQTLSTQKKEQIDLQSKNGQTANSHFNDKDEFEKLEISVTFIIDKFKKLFDIRNKIKIIIDFEDRIFYLNYDLGLIKNQQDEFLYDLCRIELILTAQQSLINTEQLNEKKLKEKSINEGYEKCLQEISIYCSNKKKIQILTI